MLSDVAPQLVAGHLEVGFEGTHDAIESYSRFACFDRYPYTGCNRIQAVAKTLADIQQDCATFGIRGPNLWRNSPCRALVCVHLPPPYTNVADKTRELERDAPSRRRIRLDSVPFIS